MLQHIDPVLLSLIGGVIGLLIVASIVARALSGRSSTGDSPTIANLKARINAWWGIVLLLGMAIGGGMTTATILFCMVSFLALREFITLTPTRAGDHHTLFWVFFIITPLQYYLIYIRWYGMFSIMIPLYAFLFIPLRNALAGDCEHFLERTAKIQWGLMICVFSLSHALALLTLDITGYAGRNARLLIFLILVDQMSDILQYVFGKTLGKRKIAPVVSPSKTWEGFLGGTISSTILGGCLWWATPFTPLQAAGMSLLIVLLGFSGGLTMSAIKRDRGVKDYGNLIPGHGGIMDRIDSLCFAAPVFFHITRFFFDSASSTLPG